MYENIFLKPFLPILSIEEFARRVKEIPVLKTENTCDRELELGRIEKDLFVPFSIHYRLYMRIMSLLHQRYSHWDQKKFIQLLNELNANEGEEGPVSSQFVDKHISGLCLFGLTGMGKTTLVDKIIGLSPPLIKHKKIGIKQIPFLRIDCATTTKQLCISFIFAIGRMLGKKDPLAGHHKDGEAKLLEVMKNMAATNMLGMLIVDEVHNLAPCKSESNQKVLDLFKELANKVGVPILYLGTDKAVPILFEDFQTSSRAVGAGFPSLDRFREDNPEWKYFLKQLWKVQIFPEPGELTDEIMACYYYHSQGILRQVLQVHRLAQEIANDQEQTQISVEIINQTRQYLTGTTQFIDALRNQNLSVAGKGLTMTNFELYNIGENNNKLNSEKTDRLILSLIKSNKFLNRIQAKEIVELVLTKFPLLDDSELQIKLTEAVSNLQSNGIVSDIQVEKRKGDMLELCKGLNSSQDIYTLLCSHKFISNLQEFL